MAELSALGLKAKLTSLSKVAKVSPVRIGVGSGLHLLVKPGQVSGSGAWVLRTTIAGKRRDMGLGNYPQTSLAEARMAAQSARSASKKGSDPIAERAAAKAALARKSSDSFKSVAEAYYDAKAPEWKNDKHGHQWQSSLEKHVFPVVGDKAVSEVDTADVLAVLQPIWTTIPETASRIRGRIEAVLNYASATGLRPRAPNPASWRGHLSEVLGSPSKLKAAVRRSRGLADNHPSLPFQQLPAFMAALREKAGIAALALQFAILTAARSGEVRHMRWSEIDLAKGVWSIPSARMKAGKAHFVPLSKVGLNVLAQLEPLASGAGSLVFPSRKAERPLSDMALSQLVRGMSYDGLAAGELPLWRDELGNAIVPHGFRASFKAWSLTNGWADHLSELALAHTDANRVRAAYARDPLVEERRAMMEAWAAACVFAS